MLLTAAYSLNHLYFSAASVRLIRLHKDYYQLHPCSQIATMDSFTHSDNSKGGIEMTKKTHSPVNITLRIPGGWQHPKELRDCIPDGYQLSGDRLILPDQSEIEINLLPADGKFPSIFRTSLRQPANARELKIVDRYTVNVGLTGPGGSLEAAHRMMQAASAFIQAGAAGVFIDNCCLAHGAEDWRGMTDEGSSDSISFAFVAIVRGDREVWTMGMHVPGYPEIVMKRADVEADDGTIIEMIRYVCAGDREVSDGHIIADEKGPRFRIQHEASANSNLPAPMRNPFGRLRMTSFKDIAERN
jgi:hypothetical protein